MIVMNHTLCSGSDSKRSVSEEGMSFKGIEDTRVRGVVLDNLIAAISTRKNIH